jgi:hypothetical protein
MKKSKVIEALRVATEVAAIKAALKKYGYTIRKQARQAAWTIVTPNDSYKLTYQPAPISAWVLHPQSDNPNRQSLLNIISLVRRSQRRSLLGRAGEMSCGAHVTELNPIVLSVSSWLDERHRLAQKLKFRRLLASDELDRLTLDGAPHLVHQLPAFPCK